MGKDKQIKITPREFSAGGVVFKKNNFLWLITRSTPSDLFPGEYWRLPKGWLDDEVENAYPGVLARGEERATAEKIQSAALREVREEGGVEAKIIGKVGTINYFSTSPRGKVLKFATFYLMEWVRDLPEGPGFETSEVLWLPFENAYEKLTTSKEKEILKKAREALERLV
ncbi:NUDIX domain-containing protein [Candidatus Woesebacteria bacterium]|nr:NUDIX domain-containing protein [Candidatus Woesebacteria bacterium]